MIWPVEKDDRVRAREDAEAIVATDEPKPLKYQLIDLLAEPDIEDNAKQAVWGVLVYLTS